MKKVGILVLTILIIVALEVIVRQVYNPAVLDPKYQYDAIDWLQKHVSLNSAGYRDDEYQLERNESRRIYIIGDSYSFGWFINDVNDTYGQIVEKNFLKSQQKVEVINASQWGFNFKEIVNRYLWEGKQYHPDLVILGLTNYKVDVNNNKFLRRADFTLPEFIRKSRIYHLLLGRIFQRNADIANEKMYLSFYNKNTAEWKEFDQELTKLSLEVKKSGSKLAIVLFPYIYPPRPSTQYEYKAFNNALLEFGKKHNVLIIDPLEIFEKYKNKKELVLNPFDAHPTENMHKIVAEQVLKMVKPSELEFFPPSKQIVTIEKIGDTLPQYNFINKVTSSINKYPWIVREEKYPENQTTPINNNEGQQTYILADKIISSISTQPGQEMSYYLYPIVDGQIRIPRNIHGYDITGFIKFFGIRNALTVPFNPSKIRLDNDQFIIDYPKSNFDVVKAHVVIGANTLVISDKNIVKDAITLRHFKTIATHNTQKLSFNVAGSVIGFPQLDSSQGLKSIANSYPVIKTILKKIGFVNDKVKLTPQAKLLLTPNSGKLYIFVDSTYLPMASFIQIGNKLNLNFDRTLNKGTKIEFYITENMKIDSNVTVEFEEIVPTSEY